MIHSSQKKKIRRKALSIVAKSRTLTLLYALLSKQFWREINTVVQGINQYYKDRNDRHQTTSPLLRRNIHRIEKGIIMTPRKPTFALEYIEETIEEYIKCVATNEFDSVELKWAYDVLNQYFISVKSTPFISIMRSKFNNSTANIDADSSTKFSPLQVNSDKASIDPAAFQKLCQNRFSTRHFLGKQVPRDIIKQAIDIAGTAPSACNRQPYRFHLASDDKICSKISNLALGTSGYRDHIHNLFVVTASSSYYEFERDRHIIYIDSSLATMQLVLALESFGLASCIINWPDIEGREQKLSHALNLAPHERAIMLIAFGYPDDNAKTPYSAKLDSKTLLKDITK